MMEEFCWSVWRSNEALIGLILACFCERWNLRCIKKMWLLTKEWIGGINVWLNHWTTALKTALVEVVAEQMVLYGQWEKVDEIHLVFDSTLHVGMNFVRIHPHGLESKFGKVGSKIVEATIDALMHVVVKYGWHLVLHTYQHRDTVQHITDRAMWFAAERLQQVRDLHCDVDFLPLPIVVCVVVGQIVKGFDKKLHR
mgnify:CR=1 FL=1